MKGKDIIFGLNDVGNDLIERAEYGQFPSGKKANEEKAASGLKLFRKPLAIADSIALIVLLMG